MPVAETLHHTEIIAPEPATSTLAAPTADTALPLESSQPFWFSKQQDPEGYEWLSQTTGFGIHPYTFLNSCKTHFATPLPQHLNPDLALPWWCAPCSKTLPGHSERTARYCVQHFMGAKHLKARRDFMRTLGMRDVSSIQELASDGDPSAGADAPTTKGAPSVMRKVKMEPTDVPMDGNNIRDPVDIDWKEGLEHGTGPRPTCSSYWTHLDTEWRCKIMNFQHTAKVCMPMP